MITQYRQQKTARVHQTLQQQTDSHIHKHALNPVLLLLAFHSKTIITLPFCNNHSSHQPHYAMTKIIISQ